jgi:hypothetical protein
MPNNPLASGDSVLIARGRACIRMMEAAEVLLESNKDINEIETFREARDLARWRLREIVAHQDQAIVAAIMVASDKHLGTVGDILLN